MARTRYIVNHQGRTWYLDGDDTDVLDYWKQRGASIKAETTTEHDVRGIPMQHVGDCDLERLGDMAQAHDWDHIMHMVRNEQQRRVKL